MANVDRECNLSNFNFQQKRGRRASNDKYASRIQWRVKRKRDLKEEVFR